MIYQGSNKPLVFEFDEDMSVQSYIEIALIRLGIVRKKWTKANMTINSKVITCPLTQAETVALPYGEYTVEIKYMGTDGVVKIAKTCVEIVSKRYNKSVMGSDGQILEADDIIVKVSELEQTVIVRAKAPYIGTNGNWFEYSTTQSKFVDTGINAKGKDGQSSGSDYDNIKNPIKYRVGLISDVHVGYWNGKNDLVRALETLSKIGCSDVCFCGDIQTLTSFNETEYNLFTEAMEGSDYTLGENFFSCRGNHDVFCTEEYWKNVTKCDSNFYFTKGEDVFLFLSPNPDLNDDGVWTVTYADAYAYLQTIKPQIDGKRMFVFIHYPFYNHAGVQPNKTYGFKSDDVYGNAFYTYFKSQKALVFGGHSHLSYTDEQYQSNLNVDRDGTDNFATVHLMSPAANRAYDYSTTHNIDVNDSECMVMDICDGFVVLHCIDLASQKVMDYNYVMFDDLGRTRKALVDLVYTFTETKYATEINACKSAYSDSFSSKATVDSAILGITNKLVDEIINIPAPTNMISTSTNADGTIYNGVGYKANTRIKSTGADADYTTNPCGATGYMPIEEGDKILLTNCGLSSTNNVYCCIALYDASFNVIKSTYADWYPNNAYTVGCTITETVDADGNINSITFAELTNVAYIRISASDIGASSVIVKE